MVSGVTTYFVDIAPSYEICLLTKKSKSSHKSLCIIKFLSFYRHNRAWEVKLFMQRSFFVVVVIVIIRCRHDKRWNIKWIVIFTKVLFTTDIIRRTMFLDFWISARSCQKSGKIGQNLQLRLHIIPHNAPENCSHLWKKNSHIQILNVYICDYKMAAYAKIGW